MFSLAEITLDSEKQNLFGMLAFKNNNNNNHNNKVGLCVIVTPSLKDSLQN